MVIHAPMITTVLVAILNDSDLMTLDEGTHLYHRHIAAIGLMTAATVSVLARPQGTRPRTRSRPCAQINQSIN